MDDEMFGFAEEYLADGGPLSMLEPGVSGPGVDREFHGRPMFLERLHSVALAIDVTTRLLATLDRFFRDTADDVANWPCTTDPSITPATRDVWSHPGPSGDRCRRDELRPRVPGRRTPTRPGSDHDRRSTGQALHPCGGG